MRSALPSTIDRLVENAVATEAVAGAIAIVTGPDAVRYEGAAGHLHASGGELTGVRA